MMSIKMSPKIALVLAMLLPLASYATPHSGTSSSYKSGFSSQRSSPPKSAPKSPNKFGAFSPRTPDQVAPTPAPPAANDPSAAPRSGFGSFGNAQAPAQGKSGSALSRDLNQSSANTNALNTLDGRRAAAAGAAGAAGAGAAGGGLPPVNNPVPGQQPGGPQQGYAQPGYAYQQPIIVQQPSSGFGSMFMGFMLGRALSGGHHDTVVYQNGQPVQNGQNVQGQYAANDGSLSPAQVAANDAQMQPKSSFGMTVLRTFLWLLILGCLVWIVAFILKLARGGKSAGSGANYTFRK